MSRFVKIVVAVVVLVGIIVGLNYRGSKKTPAPTGTTQTPTPQTRTPVTPVKKTDGRKRQIASIVYLDQTGLPSGTLAALADMHATEVYLYVAEHSTAYFQIPNNPYMMVVPADTLRQACNTLHANGYKVIAVISSALIDRVYSQGKGAPISQTNSDIINPQTAYPFVSSLVDALMKYPVDGIYVGEPYWDGYNERDKHPLTASQIEAWHSFYSKLVQQTKANHVPMYLELPDLYARGVGAVNISGVPDTVAKLPFQGVGIDLEDAYQGFGSTDLLRFQNATNKAKALNPSAESSVEVSIRKGDLKTPVPPDFFEQELKIASDANIDTVMIFANEWWLNSPNREAYKQDIEAFLNGQ